MKKQLQNNNLKKYINRAQAKKIFSETYKLIFDICLLIRLRSQKTINSKEFKIVTGCDSSHFNSLVNLLKSIKKHEPYTETVVYNLGLSSDEITYLKNNFDFKVINFEFKKYPKFIGEIDLSNKLGSYGWKPIIINKEYSKNDKNLLWLDAGCLLTKKLALLKKYILKVGFYSPESSNSVKDWSHISTIQKLNLPSKYLNSPNFSGGLVGIAQNDKKIKELINKWEYFALDKETIAPKGSSRDNHRQDQTILTLLVYILEINNNLFKSHRIFGLLKDQDNEKFKYI
jgi:hypothetical protein